MSYPPPSAVFVAIPGLRGAADQAAVEAAILACDPAAWIWHDWARERVAVETQAPPEAVSRAIAAAGFAPRLVPAAEALAVALRAGSAAQPPADASVEARSAPVPAAGVAGKAAARLEPDPAQEPDPPALAVLIRILGGGFAGLVVGGLLGASLGLGYQAVDPACTVPEDVGDCARLGATLTIIFAGLGVIPGVALAFVARR